MHVFRYSVSIDGGPLRVVKDFSQQRDFNWMPELYEHGASVRVTVRNNDTKEAADDVANFRIVSRLKGSTPVVTPTWHPLIALFSAPACPQGNQFRVAFRPVGDEITSRTPEQPCRGSGSDNLYIAGMRADTEYEIREESNDKHGDWLHFHTGMVDGSFPPVTVG